MFLGVIGRRENVIERLQTQLETKKKRVKNEVVELEDNDIKRIEAELKVLKTRLIKSN